MPICKRWVGHSIKGLLGIYIVILVCTALAKLISAFGHEPVLNELDFVVPIRMRNLLALTGICELGVVAVILYSSQTCFKLLAVNALSSFFLLYRLIRGADTAHHCPCLGTIGAQLGLDGKTTDLFLATVAIGMFVSSLTILMVIIKYPKAVEFSDSANQQRLGGGIC